ncbi:MAG: nucleoside kinase [Lachnospiraceae bacterium]|nr:nucleoside kinase [Lachnospiraceae bacterium]MCD7767019.1 nucleoside kinase [Lachnospiraceae bacterium]
MDSVNEKKVTVYVEGLPEIYPDGTTYREIADAHQKDFSCPIALVKADGRLRELHKKASPGCRLRFVTLKDKAGCDTYRRSLVLLMLKGIYHVAGENSNIEKVSVHFSVGESYYCTMEGQIPLTEAFLEEVKQYMLTLVRQAAPIRKKTIATWEACARFREYRMYDKEELFRYRRSSKVNIYELESFEDYFYGYMLPDASYLTCFDLRLYEDGFLLCFPSQAEPGKLTDFTPTALPGCVSADAAEMQNKIWRTQKDALEWGKKLEIPTVGALNTYIVKHRTKDLIMIQEAYHEKKIAEMAASIAASPEKRVILIAGPSSSGKTTFSHRLSTQLSVYGLKPHPIEADNYFVEREHTPLDEDGKPNFECLEAIDTEKLNNDMLALLAGEKVELPTFNFKTGKREYKGDVRTLGPQDILIIEGIHCLNDRLTYRLDSDHKVKIYISALTQLNIDEHNRIPTTDGRLIRRMVRDARMRGTDAHGTIAMWPSVRRGEEQYIFPYQESADYIFNSTLIYELAVLKQYAEPLLFSVRPDEPEYEEAKRLLKFLDYFLPIPGDDIPNNSLIREFIGGSCFEK